MKKTKLISMVLALTMILPSASALAAERGRASPAEAFTDFDPNAWYRPAIEYAVEHEIMKGMGDGLMAPDRTTTRAEFVAMACRLLDTYTMADVSQYEDLPPDAWYYDSMRMGFQLGIIEGVSGSQADPSGCLTREQAIVILARMMALPDGPNDELERYSDMGDISDWAQGAVSAMTTGGYLKGYPDGTLRPKQSISRAEAAQLLLRCFPLLINESDIHNSEFEQNLVLRERPMEMENVQANGVTVLAPGMGDGTANLKNCQVARLVCWGGKDIYIHPGCGSNEIVLARTDGPCVIHWLGSASELPKVTFAERCHPDCKVVDQHGNVLLPAASGAKPYRKQYTEAERAEIEKLNALTTAGTVRINCETDFLATIGADKLPCQIRSHADNKQPLRVELLRADTGEVVAYIDHLAPGEAVTEMTIAAMPEYGNYEAKLVFRDNSGKHQAELQATLYVAYFWNRGES